MSERFDRVTLAGARWALTGHGYSHADAIEISDRMTAEGVDIGDSGQLRAWLQRHGQEWPQTLG